MGARGETLADWNKVTAAEKWSVGVVAHHIASSHEGLSGAVKMLADGKPPMSAGQLAGGRLCGHMDEHLRSIRVTVGH